MADLSDIFLKRLEDFLAALHAADELGQATSSEVDLAAEALAEAGLALGLGDAYLKEALLERKRHRRASAA